MRKILIIEDDENIVDLIDIHIDDINGQLFKAHDGETGLKMAMTNEYDLIILDLMLPKLSGLDISFKLRSEGVLTPILMLTAKSEEIDKVLGLETGADDYMTKPFSIRELLARIKAILRRTNSAGNVKKSIVIERGDLYIDLDKKMVLCGGERINLSKKEFELLSLMAANPGKSYNRSNLLRLIWGYDFAGYEHTVNSHINRLRSKIEQDHANPKYILTSWGIGYRFNEDI